mmetsp:Transcript_6568/g.9642  ORF Transcript_6568/g.9642 Transcript_6568/m.9642 type:complete len:115 (+) Transcript_6568:385-729(+)
MNLSEEKVDIDNGNHHSAARERTSIRQIVLLPDQNTEETRELQCDKTLSNFSFNESPNEEGECEQYHPPPKLTNAPPLSPHVLKPSLQQKKQIWQRRGRFLVWPANEEHSSSSI